MPDRIDGRLASHNLDLGRLAGGLLPPALLEAEGAFSAALYEGTRLSFASVDLDVAEGSSWNDQPLSGKLAGAVHAPAGGQASAGALPDWHMLALEDLD